MLDSYKGRLYLELWEILTVQSLKATWESGLLSSEQLISLNSIQKSSFHCVDVVRASTNHLDTYQVGRDDSANKLDSTFLYFMHAAF